MAKRKSLTKNQRLAIRFIEKGICHICGEPINPIRETEEIEHPVPVALGGTAMRLAHAHCHREKTKQDRKDIAKAKRVAAKHNGTWRGSKHKIPGGKTSRFKRKVDGTVVDRATDQPLSRR